MRDFRSEQHSKSDSALVDGGEHPIAQQPGIAAGDHVGQDEGVAADPYIAFAFRCSSSLTNKGELFNKYAQWVAFGSAGLATAAERDEQRKMVKYNHLVANLLIFHTAIGMTRALDEIAADGKGAAITPEALAGTSLYLTEHLNRFGSCELDLSKPPAPLPFELPDRLRPSRRGAAVLV